MRIFRFENTTAFSGPRGSDFCKKLISLANSLCYFLTGILIKEASVYRFHYRKTKMRLDLQNQLTSSYYNNTTEPSNRQIGIIFRFENNKFCVFPKSLSYMIFCPHLQNLSTFTMAKMTTCTRTILRCKPV